MPITNPIQFPVQKPAQWIINKYLQLLNETKEQNTTPVGVIAGKILDAGEQFYNWNNREIHNQIDQYKTKGSKQYFTDKGKQAVRLVGENLPYFIPGSQAYMGLKAVDDFQKGNNLSGVINTAFAALPIVSEKALRSLVEEGRIASTLPHSEHINLTYEDFLDRLSQYHEMSPETVQYILGKHHNISPDNFSSSEILSKLNSINDDLFLLSKSGKLHVLLSPEALKELKVPDLRSAQRLFDTVKYDFGTLSGLLQFQKDNNLNFYKVYFTSPKFNPDVGVDFTIPEISTRFNKSPLVTRSHPNFPRGSSFNFIREELRRRVKNVLPKEFEIWEQLDNAFSADSAPSAISISNTVSKDRMKAGKFPGMILPQGQLNDYYGNRVLGNGYGNVNIGTLQFPKVANSGPGFQRFATFEEMQTYSSPEEAVNKINRKLAELYKTMQQNSVNSNGIKFQNFPNYEWDKSIVEDVLKSKGASASPDTKMKINGIELPMWATWSKSTGRPLFPAIKILMKRGGKLVKKKRS